MGYYGNRWQTDGLNNRTIGPSSVIAAIRDRSEHTGTLLSIDLYRKVVGGGYSAGTGGTWTVRCETDDGSGLPSGTLIAAGASVAAATPVTPDLIQRFTFATPIADILDTLRHFRVENTDGSPTVNYASMNAMDLSGMGSPNPLQPTYDDADRALLVSTGGGAFAVNRDRYPIFCLNYADGTKTGVGYYDALSGSGQREIGSGGRMVRMNFTPAASVYVTAARARVYKVAGTAADLVLNLRDLTAGGTLLETTSIPAASVNTGNTGTGYGAQYEDLAISSSPRLLTAGVNYSLEMSSTEVTNPYVSFPSRRGGAPGGFGENLASEERFLDGYWEYTTDGTTWLTHSPGTTEQQMQAYFSTYDVPAQQQVAAWILRG